jgi:hypothetical protein
MRSALVQDQGGKNQSLEAPGQAKLHPSPIRTQGLPDIELMPEDRIKPAEVRASKVNREFRARHEFEQEQKRNAAQAIAERLRLTGLGPPKPKPGQSNGTGPRHSSNVQALPVQDPTRRGTGW